MIGYGLPRHSNVEFPDIADIQTYGLKSSTGKMPEKCGDYKPYVRSANNRAQTKRYWKRKARSVAKQEIHLHN